MCVFCLCVFCVFLLFDFLWCFLLPSGYKVFVHGFLGLLFCCGVLGGYLLVYGVCGSMAKGVFVCACAGVCVGVCWCVSGARGRRPRVAFRGRSPRKGLRQRC